MAKNILKSAGIEGFTSHIFRSALTSKLGRSDVTMNINLRHTVRMHPLFVCITICLWLQLTRLAMWFQTLDAI